MAHTVVVKKLQGFPARESKQATLGKNSPQYTDWLPTLGTLETLDKFGIICEKHKVKEHDTWNKRRL